LVISTEETAKQLPMEHYVIRFKTPVDETLHLQDIIRGEVKFDTNLLDDKFCSERRDADLSFG
jgi:glutamyl-tRNA synthetase